MTVPVSQIYTIDLGLMYLILTYFIHQLVNQQSKLKRLKHLNRYRADRAFFAG